MQGGGQPQAQAQRKPPFFKADQMKQLPASQFTQADKEKYERGLTNLWTQMENSAADSKVHQDAKKKIADFSNTLFQKIRTFNMQQQQQAQQAAQSGQQPGQNAAQRSATQGQPPVPAQQTGDANAAANANLAANGAAQRPATVPKHILDHINNFPYSIPPQFPQGSADAIKYKAEQRGRLMKGLMGMETASNRIKALDEVRQQRTAGGNPYTPEEETEYKEKKEMLQKSHADAKRFVDQLRAQNNAMAAGTAAAAAGAQQPATASGQDSAARPQLNAQQPVSTASNPALQSTQTVNAAIEAARNQQLNGGRTMSQGGGQPNQGQQPLPAQNPPANIPQQGQPPNPQIKQEPGPPQLNTAVNQFQNQHRNSVGNNSPQSAQPQSAIQQQPPGLPRALSHAAALSQANRSYSSGGNPSSSGPSVMGHSHPSAPANTRESQNVMTNKMPIPKHLPERATNTPQPVAMAPSRPTYSGGPGNSNSVGAQPVIHQPPNIGNLAENGGRVLDKNKLEELVRQVTGGGQGLEGGGTLTPDVESVSSLSLFFIRLEALRSILHGRHHDMYTGLFSLIITYETSTDTPFSQLWM